MNSSKPERRGTFLCLGIAAALVVTCVGALGGTLIYISGLTVGMPQTGDLASNEATTGQTPEAPEIIISLEGKTLPDNASSAQYAVTLATDVAARVYEQTPPARIFCTLEDGEYLSDIWPVDGCFWKVTIVADEGIVSVLIDAASGLDFSAGFQGGYSEWLSSQDLTPEYGAQSLRGDQPTEEPEPYEPSDEERALMIQESRAEMEQFAATMADSAYVDEALSVVEAKVLAAGSRGVSASVCLAGSKPEYDGPRMLNVQTYEIQVTLEDGSYLFLTMAKDDMRLLSYMRSTVDFPAFLYG